MLFEILNRSLKKKRHRWERTHPCVLNAKAFKQSRQKFKLIQGKGFYAAKRDVAGKDACAPSDAAFFQTSNFQSITFSSPSEILRNFQTNYQVSQRPAAQSFDTLPIGSE